MAHITSVKCWNCDRHKPVKQVISIIKGQKKVRDLCRTCYQSSVLLEQPDGGLQISWYTPQLHQRPYHASNAPNLLALGTRDTGKSTMMRKDAIIRCMQFPGFKALILRREMPDLRKSHLRFIGGEMAQLGKEVGYYRDSTHDVVFTNGSFIQFSHCHKLSDVENYLSSEWDLIVFDEVSTFPLDMFLMVSAAARTDSEAPYRALVRCGSNPMGLGARWMKEWFIDKAVDYGAYPDYNPDDFEMQFSTLQQNKYSDRDAYEKRLRVLPAHVQRAWLKGEFVVEGAYFVDFHSLADDDGPWHAIDELPMWPGRDGTPKHMLDLGWISIYRAIDWGYNPDPAVCLWIAVLPNGHEIVFKEKHWTKTLAADVAREIRDESEGMLIADTFCDPQMFAKSGQVDFSIAETFEANGVAVTPSHNSRVDFGYAITEHLKTVITDGGRPHPKLQILADDGYGRRGCKNLLRTIPLMTMDPDDPRKIAEGEDHWVAALAYYCMGRTAPNRDPGVSTKKYWMNIPQRVRRMQRVRHI